MWHALERKVYEVLVEKPQERDHLEDQHIDGRMSSKWILQRLAERVCGGFTWLRIRASGGPL
jgi:hypothetical protein